VRADRVVAVTEPEGQDAPRKRPGKSAADVTEAAAGQALSYEQARDKLAAVVKRLEAGGLTLEQSLELWERGERLAKRDDAAPDAAGGADGEDDAPF
jgi:exodeoxyribonuclease VII small subunit